MRNYRRLPPLLRIANLLALLFSFTPLVLLSVVVAHLPNHPHLLGDMQRMETIALSLLALGGAFGITITIYNPRFRHSGAEGFPPSSWQTQARTIALLALLPICALALALFVPYSPSAYLFISMINLLGMAVIILTYLRWMAYSAAR